MQYETHIIPPSALKKLSKDQNLEAWMLRKDYYKTFETSPEEDTLLIGAADEALGNHHFITLNKHTSKKIFKALEEITQKRKLWIFDSHMAMPSIELIKTNEGYIYKDLLFYKESGLGGTKAMLDLRSREKIINSIQTSIKKINSRSYVSKETQDLIKKIQSNLNKYKNVGLFNAEQELKNIGYEVDPNDLPF